MNNRSYKTPPSPLLPPSVSRPIAPPGYRNLSPEKLKPTTVKRRFRQNKVIPPFCLGTLDSPWSGSQAHIFLALYLAVNRASRRPPSRHGIPAVVRRRLRKLTSSPTKISSPLSSSASRPQLHRHQKPPESHCHRPSGCYLTGNSPKT
jgi:hypothetical protein